eukprot:21453-Heterococcus_DN1.PRE.1
MAQAERGAPFDVKTIIKVIDHHELPLLQWVCERGPTLNEEIALAASQLDDLSALSWLHSEGCPCNYEHMCRTAASSNHIGTLQWVKETGLAEWTPSVLSEYLNVAAVCEHLDTAK